MKLRNIGIIIGREYKTRVKKKSFLVITFVVPLLFACLCSLPSIIMLFGKDEHKSVALVDESQVIGKTLKSGETYDIKDYSDVPLDSLKANMEQMGIDLVLHISALTEDNSVNVSTYSTKALSVDLIDNLKNSINSSVEDYRISQYDMGDLKAIMKEVESNVDILTYVIDESGNTKLDSAEIKMVLSMLLGMIIYMFIAMFSGAVMQSVIDEKSSRVVEVLVSSVKAIELMFGKIIGVALVALTQFFMWIALTAIIFVGLNIFVFSGMDTEQKQQMAGQMTEMTNMPGMSGVDAQMLSADSFMSKAEVNPFIASLKGLNYGEIIIYFVLFFLFGYLLYASLFAAIGSAVENEADSTQLQMPITIPLLIAFFISFYAFKSPDSPIVFWGSMIPFTSPIVMMARIPFGVPTIEILISFFILLLTFVLCAWISSKIYKIGILIFGKKTTFKDLWKWLRLK